MTSSPDRLPEEEGLPPCVEADTDEPFFWKWMMILSKATSRNPARRYRSAKGLLRDLRILRLKGPGFLQSAIRVATAVFVTGVLLPALWNLPLASGWFTLTPEWRSNVLLPYPYQFLKPIFAPRRPVKPAILVNAGEMVESMTNAVEEITSSPGAEWPP